MPASTLGGVTFLWAQRIVWGDSYYDSSSNSWGDLSGASASANALPCDEANCP